MQQLMTQRFQQFLVLIAHPVYRHSLPLVILVFAAVLSLSPTAAYSESGKRICLSEDGYYAAKFDNDYLSRNACRYDVDESNLSQSVNWGDGAVSTCEDFASQYLKWEDWDPCYEMDQAQHYQYTSPNGNYGPGRSENKIILRDSTIHKVAMIDRDDSINGKETSCGAGGCSISFSFGQSTSFTYTAGFSITEPTGIFGGSVSYSYGTGQSADLIFGYNWDHGEEPGMALNFTSQYPDWSFRNITDIQSRLRSYTKGFAESEEQKELLQMTRWCEDGDVDVEAVNYYTGGSQATFDVGGLSWFMSPNADTTYNNAILSFDDDNDDYGDGITAYFNSDAIICGQALQIVTSSSSWRSGHDSDNLKWANILVYNHIN
ncbi:MAG: hypothetical protein ACI936_001879 [Paraglaciecola sp.]|jgi:hypothetical protein